MLKKVALENADTGKIITAVVDTDDNDKAVIGAGKAANEIAKITDITGLDETIHRLSGGKGSLEDRVALFAGVARCLERNISTKKSFELQANRVKSPKYRGVIADVAEKISMGEKISSGFECHPDLFGPEVVAMIAAGEESGQLPAVFEQIANGQKKTLIIVRKLKKAMIYPAIVIVIGVAVVIAMSFTLVPALADLYGSMGADLPFATTSLMTFSDFLLKYPYMALVPFIALFAMFKNWGKIVSIPAVQRFMIKMPIVGDIVRKSSAAVSFRTFTMLVESNVRMTSALDITAAVAPNITHAEFFSRIREHIATGSGLYESFLQETSWLGPDGRRICGIMEIAGETGSATDMLNEVSNDYEDELDQVADSADKLLEPITIIFLGIMVAFLIYAIYSPIFSLGKVVLPGADDGKAAPTASK
ncbi:MAG: type II secretion system F family protein [Verrucomicrobiota bacterium]